MQSLNREYQAMSSAVESFDQRVPALRTLQSMCTTNTSTTNVHAWSRDIIHRQQLTHQVSTRNSSVDEICYWLWNFTNPILIFPVTFAYLIGTLWLFPHIVTFLLLCLINTLTYLFAYLLVSFLLIQTNASSMENMCELNFY